MLQHRTNLLCGHAGKPLNELVYGRIIFKVLEQRSDGHARAAKHPCAAQDGRVLFYGGAG